MHGCKHRVNNNLYYLRSIRIKAANFKNIDMIIETEIWEEAEKTFIKVKVVLKRYKGFPEIFKYGRAVIRNNKYVPYWFNGLDVKNKDWFLGGHYEDNFGLINLTLTGTNVEGVILDGNKLFLLQSIKRIN